MNIESQSKKLVSQQIITLSLSRVYTLGNIVIKPDVNQPLGEVGLNNPNCWAMLNEKNILLFIQFNFIKDNGKTYIFGIIYVCSFQGIIVDEDFQSILNEIRETRRFEVKYERCIQRQDEVRDMLLKELEQDCRYNVDPIRLMYILKENMRAQDFFWKINKDHDDGVTRTEMHNMFKVRS